MKKWIKSSTVPEGAYITNIDYEWALEHIFEPLADAIRNKFGKKYKTFQFDLDDIRTTKVGAYCDVNLYVGNKLRGEYEFRFVGYQDYDDENDFLQDISDTIKDFVAVLK